VQEIATAYRKLRQHTGNRDTVQEIATAYWKWLALVRHHTVAYYGKLYKYLIYIFSFLGRVKIYGVKGMVDLRLRHAGTGSPRLQAARAAARYRAGRVMSIVSYSSIFGARWQYIVVPPAAAAVVLVAYG